MAKGGDRYDINLQPYGVITEEEREKAKQKLLALQVRDLLLEQALSKWPLKAHPDS